MNFFTIGRESRELQRIVDYAVQNRNIDRLHLQAAQSQNDSITSHPTGQLSPQEIERLGGIRV